VFFLDGQRMGGCGRVTTMTKKRKGGRGEAWQNKEPKGTQEGRGQNR